jgi:hypothetical protein
MSVSAEANRREWEKVYRDARIRLRIWPHGGFRIYWRFGRLRLCVSMHGRWA